MLEKIKHFLIIIILKQKSTSDRAKGGELSPSTQCIPHLPMVGQKRSCRGTFELKTNSKWQFAIWYIETLCTPTLKLAETNTASQKSSLPSFSPQNTLPLFPDCFNMNSEAKQSTDPGQTPAFFFFFSRRLVSTSIMPLNWIAMQMFAEAAGERWHRARSELPGLEKGRTTSSKGSINVWQHGVDLRYHCLSNRKEMSLNRATD